jgi:hypothetical protein
MLNETAIAAPVNPNPEVGEHARPFPPVLRFRLRFTSAFAFGFRLHRIST